jgi:pimeloyl-ACP methyl ester carboxylesterase
MHCKRGANGDVERLAGDHRLVLVDLLGFGQSAKPHEPEPYTFDRRVEQLDLVLDAAGVDAAHMWGYSFGSMVAEAYAQARPSRVRSLVVGGMLPGLTAVDRRNIYNRYVDLYGTGDWATVFDTLYPTASAAFRDRIAARNDPLAVAALWTGSFEPFSAEANEAAAPLLCYVGTGEWFWEAAWDQVEERGGRFVAIPDTDHYATFQAADLVVPAVRSHLAEASARHVQGSAT